MNKNTSRLTNVTLIASKRIQSAFEQLKKRTEKELPYMEVKSKKPL